MFNWTWNRYTREELIKQLEFAKSSYDGCEADCIQFVIITIDAEHWDINRRF